MHLTTIVSLLAVGAAAAPAAKSLDLNTRVPMPTMTPSEELIPELPPLDLRRRQEAEKEPLDAYLETLDGDYDEAKSEDTFNKYNDSLKEKDESTVTTSTTVATKTPLPETAVNSTVSTEAKNSTIPTETKNETSSAVPEPTKDDPLDDYLGTLNGDYDEEKSEAALGHYHDSLESTSTTSTTVAASTPLADTTSSSTVLADTKNETTSAAPEPTKTAASKDPLTRLNGALPLKRQEFPEKPETPSVKRQLDGLLGSMPELSGLEEEDTATPKVSEKAVTTPEVSEKNVTTPAVPAVSEEDVVATTTDANNATSSAVPAVSEEDVVATTTDANNTTSSAVDNSTAQASTTASDGYHGINKHMAKLDKLPISLRVKRGIPTKVNNEELVNPEFEASELEAPEFKPEDVHTPTTGERPMEMPKLEWLDLEFKRQVEDVTEAVPEVNEEDVAVPEVKEEAITAPSVPVVDEKRLNSNTTVNDTASAVNATGADAASTAAAGYHGINKHLGKFAKLPIGGLPIKRQAPDFLTAPVDEPEVANAQPTGGLPTEPVLDTTESSYTVNKAESPIYKYLVPLQ